MMNLFASIEGSSFSVWLRESNSLWAFPTVLTLHTFGMMILVGCSFAVDLRILGIARHIPISSMRPLFRVMWMAFWLNLVTGTMLFCADATTKAADYMFIFKLVMVVLGVLTVVQLGKRLYGTTTDPDAPTAVLPRSLAMVSLVVWMAAVTAGRLLAYV